MQQSPAPRPILSDSERCETAYKLASETLSREFITSAVLDKERLRAVVGSGLSVSERQRSEPDICIWCNLADCDQAASQWHVENQSLRQHASRCPSIETQGPLRAIPTLPHAYCGQR